MSSRPGGRPPDALRDVRLELGAVPHAEGSCTISAGRTRVLCVATVQDAVPEWREGSGAGWVTAEYAMLPRSTGRRTPRERDGARGRTREIERLIGRALRSVTDLEALGPRTVILDCDVLIADGGTRTASVTGAMLALEGACRWLVRRGTLDRIPIHERVAAVSVGLVGGEARLDLEYVEDRDADVDLNVVGTESGRLVEVQGTAEGEPFARERLDALLDLARDGIAELVTVQGRALDDAAREEGRGGDR